MNICITNGFLITADNNDTCMDGCVQIKDDTIVYAGPEEDAPAFDPDRTIDAKGGIIAPGFVNTHTHIPMNLMRGFADDLKLMDWLNNAIWPAEEKLDAEAVYWGSMLGMAELISGGVTSMNDMYFLNDAIVRAAKDTGIRALIGTAVVDAGEGGGGRLERAVALFDKVKDLQRIDAAIAPHAEYTVSPGMFEKIRDAAMETGSRIHVHVSESEGEHLECIERHGKTPIGLLNSLGVLDVPTMAAHCVWVSDEDMDIMAEKHVGVMSCPQSNVKIGSGIAPVARMLKKGITVSCATDGAGSNNNLSMMEEMTLMAFLQKGINRDPELIPAATAIKTATIYGAKVMGMDQKTGSLEAGKQADLIVINTQGLRYCPRTNLLNHMVYSGSDADICLTMIGGDILYENGRLTYADEEEIKAKAQEYATKVLA